MKTVVLIRLEIEGKPEDAFDVVDDILDSGVLQDAINENDNAALKVLSATCEGATSLERPGGRT